MLIDFHSVYERYSKDVHRFALFLSGDLSWADDITQETFVRAWVTPGTIDGGTMKSYLLMIARNLFRSELKRRAQHVPLHELPDSRPSLDELADQAEDFARVLAALQALAESDRTILLLSAQEKMPHAEIATLLGLSVPAVKVRVHRARVKLKQQLQSVGV